MSHKSKAHKALGLLFVWEGVPPKLIINGAKEMKLGEFGRKCKVCDPSGVGGGDSYLPGFAMLLSVQAFIARINRICAEKPMECNGKSTIIFPHPGFVTESTPLQLGWRGDADLCQQG